MGNTLLSLAQEYPKIQQLVFPDADSTINLQELVNLVEYDATDESCKVAAKEYLEKYLNVLSERGV